MAFKQVTDAIDHVVVAAQALVVTTMPRGSLQIAQPAKLPEALIKGYTREFHLEDRLSWQAILSGKPVNSSDVFEDGARYLRELLEPAGYAYAAAAPLTAPVLDGYPGAVQIYRTREQGPFTADHLRRLGHAAKEIDAIFEKARDARRSSVGDPAPTLTPRPQARLFVFDEKGDQILPSADFDTFDSRIRDLVADQARVRLARLNGEMFQSDRVTLPDSRGDLWIFRAVCYRRYPAMGNDPVALFCMQPTCGEWAMVRPADLQADAELARLIPALKFMRQEFHRGPTLGEISKQVHLSPFHFHRRFAELLGLTPKHYLLECQITQAKHELLSRRKELAQIATDCGFAHQSHFTSRFKQATGLTPTRWRRLAGDTPRA